jgi:hypothetical protein
MYAVARRAAISTIALKIHTSHSGDASAQCLASGECEVFRNLLPPIRLYTTISIWKGTSTPDQTSNPAGTPRFANGATFL